MSIVIVFDVVEERGPGLGMRPEVTPVESAFQALRAELANRMFAGVAAVDAAPTDVLHVFWREPRAPRQ